MYRPENRIRWRANPGCLATALCLMLGNSLAAQTKTAEPRVNRLSQFERFARRTRIASISFGGASPG